MKTRSLVALGVLAVAAFLTLPSFFAPAAANHVPADKVSAAGATDELFAPGEEVTLLEGTLRSSSTSDLLISLSLECNIQTTVVTVGNDDSLAQGHVEAWIEIDGVPVSVGGGDDGHVVFCDRVHQQTTSLFDDENATIKSFQDTRSANAFNWVALDLGNGLHTITAKATLWTATAGNSDSAAQAWIGKRTLVVEPTKLANDAAI